MGVRGLLKFTNKFRFTHRNDKISKIKGYKVAIDSHNLMHYVYNVVESTLCRYSGRTMDGEVEEEEDDEYVVRVLTNAVVNYLALLLSNAVVIVVMDGKVPTRLGLCSHPMHLGRGSGRQPAQESGQRVLRWDPSLNLPASPEMPNCSSE